MAALCCFGLIRMNTSAPDTRAQLFITRAVAAKTIAKASERSADSINMKRTINDWEPETRSLLESLVSAGFRLDHGDNGEYEFQFTGDLAKFIEHLTACDESHLYIKTPLGRVLWMYLVYGNEPGVLVSDYSVWAEGAASDVLDAVTEQHYEKWSGRKQPKKEVEV